MTRNRVTLQSEVTFSEAVCYVVFGGLPPKPDEKLDAGEAIHPVDPEPKGSGQFSESR